MIILFDIIKKPSVFCLLAICFTCFSCSDIEKPVLLIQDNSDSAQINPNLNINTLPDAGERSLDNIVENKTGTMGLEINDQFYESIITDVYGAELPYFVSMYDEAVGLTIPQIHGTRINGEKSIIGTSGTPTIIIILAHWCPYCRNEVRDLSPYLKYLEQIEEVKIVTILTSISKNKSNYPPHEWLKLEKWSLPTMVDTSDSDIAKALGVSSFPFFIAFDAKGEIIVRLPGRLGITGLSNLIKIMSDIKTENLS